MGVERVISPKDGGGASRGRDGKRLPGVWSLLPGQSIAFGAVPVTVGGGIPPDRHWLWVQATACNTPRTEDAHVVKLPHPVSCIRPGCSQGRSAIGSVSLGC